MKLKPLSETSSSQLTWLASPPLTHSPQHTLCSWLSKFPNRMFPHAPVPLNRLFPQAGMQFLTSSVCGFLLMSQDAAQMFPLSEGLFHTLCPCLACPLLVPNPTEFPPFLPVPITFSHSTYSVARHSPCFQASILPPVCGHIYLGIASLLSLIPWDLLHASHIVGVQSISVG